MCENIFEDLMLRYQYLKTQRDTGQISQEQFLTEVKILQIQDQDGIWWMIDPASEALVYYNGERWIKDSSSTMQDSVELPWKNIALVFVLLLSIVFCILVIFAFYSIMVIASESSTTFKLASDGIF
jgi:hypothetical protein